MMSTSQLSSVLIKRSLNVFCRRIAATRPERAILQLKLQAPNVHVNKRHFHICSRVRQEAQTASVESDKIIEGVSVDKEARMVCITWSDATKDVYPFAWLRDNCQCHHCCPSPTVGRKLLMQDLDIHSASPQAWLGSGKLKLVWPDGHKSSFRPEWLSRRAFNVDARAKRRAEYKAPMHFWGAEMGQPDKLPSCDFNELMSSNETLLKWLENLEKYGFTLITSAPQKEGQVKRLSQRVGFMRQTHYNLVEFTVHSKHDPSNIAYTNAKLSLHTDLPYYEYAPGILHCIKQCTGAGGETTFSDAFSAVRELKYQHPEEYHILTTTPVYFCDLGADSIPFYKINNTPLIELNRDGKTQRVNMSAAQRDSFLDLEPEKVEAFYAAMKLFDSILHRDNNMISLKLREGDMAAFDNRRVLHGREAFEDDGSERFLSAGYLDWDEALSRLRVLRAKIYGEEESKWIPTCKEFF